MEKILEPMIDWLIEKSKHVDEPVCPFPGGGECNKAGGYRFCYYCDVAQQAYYNRNKELKA